MLRKYLQQEGLKRYPDQSPFHQNEYEYQAFVAGGDHLMIFVMEFTEWLINQDTYYPVDGKWYHWAESYQEQYVPLKLSDMFAIYERSLNLNP